jgi:hypothetical protein
VLLVGVVAFGRSVVIVGVAWYRSGTLVLANHGGTLAKGIVRGVDRDRQRANVEVVDARSGKVLGMQSSQDQLHMAMIFDSMCLMSGSTSKVVAPSRL